MTGRNLPSAGDLSDTFTEDLFDTFTDPFDPRPSASPQEIRSALTAWPPSGPGPRPPDHPDVSGMRRELGLA